MEGVQRGGELERERARERERERERTRERWCVCRCWFAWEGEKGTERKDAQERERKRETEGIITNVLTAGKLVTVPVVVENIKNTLIPC